MIHETPNATVEVFSQLGQAVLVVVLPDGTKTKVMLDAFQALKLAEMLCTAARFPLERVS